MFLLPLRSSVFLFFSNYKIDFFYFIKNKSISKSTILSNNMYVIFVAYNYHSNHEFNTNMFVAEDNATAEKMAKKWIFNMVRYCLDLKDMENAEGDTEEYIEQMLTNDTLHDVICFIEEHSDYAVDVSTVVYNH
jgi:hypothetical protein